MTELRQCLHCGVEFEPRHSRHVFHSNRCRHQGERHPSERHPVDEDVIERLFDPRRDPEEQVRDDDWHPDRGLENGEAWMALDATQTVGGRREWYLHLRDRRVR